eukprot:TRINITY_DN2875_c0_g1_i1.p1 TRINITY_DN2875_c0_g1~~TRINITY_DN2875_c0_g1_i1.p1  ORF type:complete len:437 (+),score=160.02 TRINITY_DN2875_c0_g1_i1:45-1355(+)
MTDRSIFPLGEFFEVVSEETKRDNPEEEVHVLVFRVHSLDQNFADLRIEQRLPGCHIVPVDPEVKILTLERDEERNYSKFVLAKGEEKKEYFVNNPHAEDHHNKKRRVEAGLVSLSIPSLIRKLMSTKVEEIFPSEDKKLFVAYKDELAKEVFKGLIAHDFLSCPVIHKTKQYVYGFIDHLDFLNYFIETLVASHDMPSPPGNDLWKLLEQESDFQTRKVKDLIKGKKHHRNPFQPVVQGCSLFTAVELLAKGRVSRVAVVDGHRTRHLLNVVTQSQVVKMIAQNITLLGAKAKKKVKDMDLVRKVIEVKEMDNAIEAFKKMRAENIPGVAVTDETGRLVGNISLKDLKAVDLDGKWLQRMFTPCTDFLISIDKQFPNTNRPSRSVVVRNEDTLDAVIEKLTVQNIHRVYVIDPEGKPVGIVSVGDVLREILKFDI